MARKITPQESCLFCGAFPCECGRAVVPAPAVVPASVPLPVAPVPVVVPDAPDPIATLIAAFPGAVEVMGT